MRATDGQSSLAFSEHFPLMNEQAMREPAACCAGFHSARDLGLSGPIGVMLLVCLCDLLRGKREEATHAWVVKAWSDSVK